MVCVKSSRSHNGVHTRDTIVDEAAYQSIYQYVAEWVRTMKDKGVDPNFFVLSTKAELEAYAALPEEQRRKPISTQEVEAFTQQEGIIPFNSLPAEEKGPEVETQAFTRRFVLRSIGGLHIQDTHNNRTYSLGRHRESDEGAVSLDCLTYLLNFALHHLKVQDVNAGTLDTLLAEHLHNTQMPTLV
jgi:hypothetical protein